MGGFLFSNRCFFYRVKIKFASSDLIYFQSNKT